MVRKIHLLLILTGFLGLTAGATSASAARKNGGDEPAALANQESTAEGAVTYPWPAVKGSRARIVAVIESDGTVLRAAGVSEVTHPSTGIFCIKPSKPKLDVTGLVPSVTPEWYHSSGYSLLAFFSTPNYACPTGYLEVQTYNFGSGTAVLSDTVAFSIVVP
jgi:hypothetical protein